ncbi:MAG TPA: YceI family protein [Pyrinomonadaceae bacterium]|nr:YceI family protein [Pyrinomonadaceae bacterium]
MTTETAAEVAPNIEVAVYRLNSADSTFTVQAFAEGLFSAFGHDPVIQIREFTGEVQFVPGTFADASLRLTIDPNSLTVSGDVKEKDRAEIEQTMRRDVLETAKYHEIVFASHNITVSRVAQGRYRARAIGDLSLHGTTQKSLWITAETILTENGFRAKGDFSIKQTDFGIKPYSAVGGGIKLKNELKFSFDIAAGKA